MTRDESSASSQFEEEGKDGIVSQRRYGRVTKHTGTDVYHPCATLGIDVYHLCKTFEINVCHSCTTLGTDVYHSCTTLISLLPRTEL